MTNGILMRPFLSSVIMLCCFLLWCVFVLTIDSSWNLLFLCYWTCLPRMPRPLTLNNTAITLITDQTDSVSVALGFNFLECLIGYEHTSLNLKKKTTEEEKISLTFQILLSWEGWDEMLCPYGYFRKNMQHVHIELYFSGQLTFTGLIYATGYCFWHLSYLNSDYRCHHGSWVGEPLVQPSSLGCYGVTDENSSLSNSLMQ